jgi:D-amino-acid dehydrogenase
MPTSSSTTIVIGAGVVGLSAALYLQRAGQRVIVIDALPPASAASYGNSGLISCDTAAPIALPGMLGKVPGWLFDRLGPLVIRPSYLPKVLPWLVRWVEASRLSRVFEVSDAMRSLHKEAMNCWRELLGPEHFNDLIRTVGQVRIWEGGAGSESQTELAICARHGIKAETLSEDDIRQLYPEISPNIKSGVLIPNNGYTINPQRLVQTLGNLLVAEGGQVLTERVLKIIPHSGQRGFMLMTNVNNHDVDQVVVATGAWSLALLEPFGIKVPLETERGYHAMMPSPNITLKIPVSIKNRGFGLTSMENGMRAAGTVEFAGLTASPDEQRAKNLVTQAKRVFPTLQTGEPKYWLGFRPSTPDSLPVLGPVDHIPGLFLAFGHAHWGMTGGPPTGKLISQMVTGAPLSIDSLPYSYKRFNQFI